MVKKNCVVLNVDAGVDYRLRVLKQAQLFKSPLGNEAQSWISERYTALTHTQTNSHEPIVINNRVVETLGHTEDVLWCEFSELCLKPVVQQTLLKLPIFIIRFWSAMFLT